MSNNKKDLKHEDINNDIDFSTFILTLAKHWKLFLIMILLCSSVLGIRALNSRSTTYYANTQVYIKRSVEKQESLLTLDVELSNGITNDFVDILKSDLVIDKVISNLSLDISASDIKSKLKVERNDKNQIINIYVAYEDLNDAISIVNEITKVGIDELRAMYGDVTKVLEVANSAKQNINGDPLINEVIKGAILGFVVPFLLVSAIYVFNNKFRKVEEVERILDIPVICVVANVKNRGKK